MKTANLLFFCMWICLGCWGSEIDVPSEAPTIQAGLAAASEGDTVVVSPGVYLENLQFTGRNVVLRSTNPASSAIVAATIIDGQSSGSVLKLFGTETTGTVITGLTIRNGRSGTLAGGIQAEYTSATIEFCVIENNIGYNGGGISHAYGTIRNCIIRNNQAKSGGGLWWCRNSEITDNIITSNSATWAAPFQSNGKGGGLAYCGDFIARNLITNNTCTGTGGGLYNCPGLISQNTISNNYAGWNGGGLYACSHGIERNRICFNVVGPNEHGFGFGGGLSGCFDIRNNLIYANNAASAGGGIDGSNFIYNNVVYANTAVYSAGGIHTSYSVTNNIVWANVATTESQVGGGYQPDHCCVQDWTGPGDGNITADPQFVDALSSNFDIAAQSPCVDAGTSVPVFEDFEGRCRPAAPSNDTTEPLYDIGAYEVPGLCGTVTEGPDLEGLWQNTSVICRGTSQSKCRVRTELLVRNTGTALSSATRVTIYVSGQPVLDGSERRLRSLRLKPLLPGAAKTLRLTINLRRSNAVSYIMAVVDSANLIDEIDENNNQTTYGPMP